MQKNLDKLVTLRSKQKISDDFMFARPGNTRIPFRGVDCLKNIFVQADLKFPELITSTSLRKQLATMTQVLNLNDTSQDLLAALKVMISAYIDRFIVYQKKPCKLRKFQNCFTA